MHQLSPGVERAVTGARRWAHQLGSEAIRLSHFLLALLDEEEGKPALLIEALGADPASIRSHLMEMVNSPVAPADTVLFQSAYEWSLATRHDPELLTDALLVAILRFEPAFLRGMSELGLDAGRIEKIILHEFGCHVDGAEVPLTPPSDFTLPSSDRTEALRILDANWNRAREATRVVEDYCRFVLNDRLLTSTVKDFRHALAAISGRIPVQELVSSRDTPGDVGTSLTSVGEYVRSSAAHVAMANLKRLQESLRSLEEFGKLFAPHVGMGFENARYQAYTLEQAITTVVRAREKLSGVKLLVIVSGEGCELPLDLMIARAAAGGAGIFQLREKGLSDRELLTRARNVREWTRTAGVMFIVNDRPDIASLADADGIHLGQDDLSVKEARRIVGPDRLIGVSTHSIEQVRQAIIDGADYLGVGPVFRSPTKAFDQFPGLEFVRHAAEETSLPSFALGGITVENVGQVVSAGARRIAVSSAVIRSKEPDRIARELSDALARSLDPAH